MGSGEKPRRHEGHEEKAADELDGRVCVRVWRGHELELLCGGCAASWCPLDRCRQTVRGAVDGERLTSADMQSMTDLIALAEPVGPHAELLC